MIFAVDWNLLWELIIVRDIYIYKGVVKWSTKSNMIFSTFVEERRKRYVGIIKIIHWKYKDNASMVYIICEIYASSFIYSCSLNNWHLQKKWDIKYSKYRKYMAKFGWTNFVHVNTQYLDCVGLSNTLVY